MNWAGGPRIPGNKVKTIRNMVVKLQFIIVGPKVYVFVILLDSTNFTSLGISQSHTFINHLP